MKPKTSEHTKALKGQRPEQEAKAAGCGSPAYISQGLGGHVTTRLPHPTPLPFTPHITYSFPSTANLPSTRRSYPPPHSTFKTWTSARWPLRSISTIIYCGTGLLLCC